MRLEKTVKYLLLQNSNKNAKWILHLLVLFCFNINAQKYSYNCDTCTLSEALMQVSDKYKVKFAFDATKLQSVIVSSPVTGNTADEFINNILGNSTLTFQYKYGRYLIFDREDHAKKNKVPECQLIGSVSDAETGEQLPYATIIDVNNSVSNSSAPNGAFVVKNIFENPAHLKISYIGYHTIDTLLKWVGLQVNCTIKLNRKIEMIDSVVVKAVRLEMVDFRNDVDFATTINPIKLTDLPVVVETDMLKTLQLLPGISYTANSSELSIRGGSSDQNLVLFDGQTLYNLSHYYGVVSVLNPNVIKDIQVYKGGYDSRYGERVSGIVDITGKSGNLTKPLVYGDINLVCGNVTAEIPVGNKITIVAAYRRSYSDIYNTNLSNFLENSRSHSFREDTANLVYQTNPKFYFSDYNTKVTYRASDRSIFSVNYFGSKDNYDNSYEGSTGKLDISTVDKNEWGNYGLSANWQKQWNDSYFSILQAGTSGYANDYENKTAITPLQSNNPPNPYLPDATNNFNSFENNELTDISVSLRNIWYVNTHHQLNFGALTRRNTVNFHKDAETIYVYDNIDQTAWFTSAYAQDRIYLSDKLVLKPGIRLGLYSGTGKIYIEPRLALNYKFNDKFSVRAATGRYYQFLSQVISQQESGYNKNFWVLADGSKHPKIASTHFITGSTFEKGKFLLDAEVYYKNFNGLQEYAFISPYRKNSDFTDYFPGKNKNYPGPKGQMKSALAQAPPPAPIPASKEPGYYFSGKGEAYGVDLFVRYKSGAYTSWLSYSLGKSIHVFDSINNGNPIPAPTDQTHQLSLTHMLTVKKWNFSATTLYSTGRPYIDYSTTNKPIPTDRVYKRLPDYFRTDVSANYNFRIQSVRLKVGVTVVNIFDSQNYFDINTRKFDFETTSFAETNLIKSQELSLNFYLHFSI